MRSRKNPRTKNAVKETPNSFGNTCLKFIPIDGRRGYGKVIKPSLPSRLIHLLKYGAM